MRAHETTFPFESNPDWAIYIRHIFWIINQ